jgi:hypothetical protein
VFTRRFESALYAGFWLIHRIRQKVDRQRTGHVQFRSGRYSLDAACLIEGITVVVIDFLQYGIGRFSIHATYQGFMREDAARSQVDDGKA